MRKYRDLTGEIFGKWKVLYEAEPEYDNFNHLRRFWICECSCENHTIRKVDAHSLTSGHSTSCGCTRLENAIPAMRKARKEENIFIPNDSYCEVYDTLGNKFYIDNDDIDKVKEHYWYMCVVNKNSQNKKPTPYIFTHIRNTETKKDDKISLHQFLMGEKYADHINHNGLDNRRCNLRVSNDPSISNQSMNNCNQDRTKYSSCGVTGVRYDKRNKKWTASIGVNHKTINLGSYNTMDEAVLARKKAEDKYYGNYSYDKSKEIAKEIAI